MITRARILAAGVLSLAVIALGCNSSNPDAPCHVSGKVTYNDSPVGGGFVLFHTTEGYPVKIPIFANGTYSTDLKEGTYTVTVETESLNPANKKEYNSSTSAGGSNKMYGAKMAPAAGGKHAAKSSPAPEGAETSTGTYVKIPHKYADKASSNLTVTLKRGKNEYNIPLTD